MTALPIVPRSICCSRYEVNLFHSNRCAAAEPALHSSRSTDLRFAADHPHIWWGVSVENKKHGVPRIDQLRAAPAAVRFLSVEPLLEDVGAINLDKINWVIVGGESGNGARPMKKEWVVSIKDQCQNNRVSFFFK
jgi:protein gp37